jgi:diguanylate cyclase (GGDEF)-like protein
MLLIGLSHIYSEAVRRDGEQLRAAADHDVLSGLRNRGSLLRAADALDTAEAAPTWVVFIDIDHFKAVNDAHGHPAGDTALIAVTSALRTHMRAEDSLGRLGGEEFLAVLPDTDHDAALAAAERMREEVAATPIEHAGIPLALTVSLGVATWEPEEPPELLLRRADDALYAAKAAGRDRVLGAPATVPRRT